MQSSLSDAGQGFAASKRKQIGSESTRNLKVISKKRHILAAMSAQIFTLVNENDNNTTSEVTCMDIA